MKKTTTAALAALTAMAVSGALAAPSGATFAGPNGNRILFTRGVSNPFPQDNIFSVSATGGTAKQLTHATAAGDAEFSPNGKKVAFDSSDGISDPSQIFLMSPSGKHKHQITHSKQTSFDPTWSPSGKRLAFAGFRKSKDGIFTMNAHGKHVRFVAGFPSGSTFGAAWSPNGKQIAFESNTSGNFDIYTVNAKGGKPHDITKKSSFFDGDADYSPNGKWILFDSNGFIERMHPDGSHIQTLSTGPNDSGPKYSPNARRIVYTAGDHLVIAHANGSHSHTLITPPMGLSDFAPTWQAAP